MIFFFFKLAVSVRVDQDQTLGVFEVERAYENMSQENTHKIVFFSALLTGLSSHSLNCSNSSSLSRGDWKSCLHVMACHVEGWRTEATFVNSKLTVAASCLTCCLMFSRSSRSCNCADERIMLKEKEIRWHNIDNTQERGLTDIWLGN